MTRRRPQHPRRRESSAAPSRARRKPRELLGIAVVIVIAAFGFGGLAWHLLTDLMVDVTVYIPPDDLAGGRHWVRQLRSAGLWVHVTEGISSAYVRLSKVVPQDAGALQTLSMTVKPERYVIAGHVPVDIVTKVLAERPHIRGLVLPNRPIEAFGAAQESSAHSHVLALLHDGRTITYVPESE
jgi:hypothetical protein